MSSPIIFLHAIGGSSASWKRQLPYFPGSKAIDLTAETIQGMADQAAKAGHAHWVGLSMGGVVALELYRTRPELVRSLTLACTWAKHPEGTARIRFLEDSLSRMTLRQFAAGSRSFLLAPETSDEIAREVFEIEASKDPALYRKQWRSMFEADLSSIVPKIPTLLIGASLDQITPVESCLRPIPHKRLVVIEGANHFVQLDRPDEFNRILKEFLPWET